MKPMRFGVSTAIGTLVFVFSSMAPLYGLDLALIEVKEERKGDDVTFSGQFKNNGTQIIDNPVIVLTLKRGDLVVAVQEAEIRGSQHEACESRNDRIRSILDFPLYSGETGSFEVSISDVVYDWFTSRVQGQVSDLDPCLVVGDLEIRPETVNIVGQGTSGGVSILGEFVNKTNAVVSDVNLEFKLYDNQGSFLGSVRTSLGAEEVLPGDGRSFAASTGLFSDLSVEDVARWEASWNFTTVRLGLDTEVPTVTTSQSWGYIKSLDFPQE